VDTRDRLVVLGNDQGRLLVELQGRHYGGPQYEFLLNPVMTNGTLDFEEGKLGLGRACLDKMKLWIGRDVFVALKALQVPPDQRALAKQRDEENKAAMRRATNNQ
jgi:hypothetical protein